MTWVNDILQGIFLGGAYALTAVGLSLMFGVMRMVNLAHGDLAVCGTYLATTVMAAFGVPLWAAMLIMVPLAFLLGMVRPTRPTPAGCPPAASMWPQCTWAGWCCPGWPCSS